MFVTSPLNNISLEYNYGLKSTHIFSSWIYPSDNNKHIGKLSKSDKVLPHSWLLKWLSGVCSAAAAQPPSTISGAPFLTVLTWHFGGVQVLHSINKIHSQMRLARMLANFRTWLSHFGVSLEERLWLWILGWISYSPTRRQS